MNLPVINEKNMIDINNIKILGEIGTGSISITYKALYKNKYVAVKIPRSNKNINNIDEYKILKDLDHPNIISIHNEFSGITKDGILILPLYNGTLQDLINNDKVHEELLIEIIRQIIPALVYLRSKNIYHNDIFLDNILYSYHNNIYHFVISDFGGATRDKPHINYDWSYHEDPILYTDNIHANISDIWSFLYILLHEYTHIYNVPNNIRNMPKEYIIDYIVSEFKNKIKSSFLRDLISRTLTLNYDIRLTSKNILQHPFIINK